MPMNRKPFTWAVLLLLLPSLCLAWFNEQWTSRKQMTLDAGATGADIRETLQGFPLLLRLHPGNFGFFLDLAEQGRDLRFFQDDKTPLPYQIEQLDTLSEIGLVWVRLPSVHGGADSDSFWMYYGNSQAADSSDGKHLYDSAQALVYHFKEGEALPQDSSAYASHAAQSAAHIFPGGWIGAAALFNGNSPMRIDAAPHLQISTDKGWSFSAWVKIDQPQNQARLLEAVDGGNGLSLAVQGTALSARWQQPTGAAETPAVNLGLGRWQHVALVVEAGHLTLYLDGAAVANTAIGTAAFQPGLTLGAQFNGLLDEVQIAAAARSADWIKLAYRSQSPDFSVINFGADESNSSGDGHFQVIVQNVTADGWAVIGLTGLMLAVALAVMFGKTVVIRRVRADNRRFMAAYAGLSFRQIDSLDQPESPEQRELAESDFANALLGSHQHYQSSPLYHLYHLAMGELKLLQAGADRPLSPEAWHYLRVKLNSRIVEESRRLNSNMVLLTIAIAGGPFLGLLGTVIGVMITFAAIAASGDVNINSIAPGIAAALLATVAGLAVAIPSLFAYNYLLSHIKEIVSGMRVFSDELLALLSMRAVGQLQGD